jgi:fructose-bisphosphate aldolase class I
MNKSLNSIARALMADPKGLLAADESTKSCCKRFDALKIPCNDESRRQWRQILCMSPNINRYISGVILYDETIRQSVDGGVTFAKALEQNGVIPGIKVDKGLVPMDNFDPQTITEGLDGLAERLNEYYQMGARFTKWRSAFQIGPNSPSLSVIRANLVVMARYASMVQTAGMVPIVEPEVLYDGDHSIEQAYRVICQVLDILFEQLELLKVDLSGLILKTSMVLAGKESKLSSPDEVAEYTLKALNKCVPHKVAGIVFLSGGQAPEQASANLNAIGLRGHQPWPITYSYSRAVQDPVMKLWKGKQANTKKAQTKFIQLLAQNSAARNGEYTS